jgi:hypothetical protein
VCEISFFVSDLKNRPEFQNFSNIGDVVMTSIANPDHDQTPACEIIREQESPLE